MAIRRRTLVLLAAATVLGFVAVVIGAAAIWVGSPSGLRFIRALAMRQLAARIDGRVYMGTIRGSPLGGELAIDSIEIRDANDSVLAASGPVSFAYALADLIDGRLVVRRVRIDRPVLHLREDSTGGWSHEMRARQRRLPLRTRPPGSRFGDIVIVESLTVRDGDFRISDFAGTKRHWTALQLDVPWARLRHPDSAGVRVRIARLDVHESDPPFVVRDAAGTVDITHDTVRFDVAAFRLSGSAGSARGTIATDDGLALDIQVVADTLSLADIAWLTPTFPTEGGGRLVLDIRKLRTSAVVHYALSRLDVRTAHSRLVGAMTFGVSDTGITLTDVDVELAPVDFRLFEEFAGAPLAMPWAGQLRGRVRGPGGPLDRFIIDDATIEFADANVPGVVNRFRGAGELDVLRPESTAFHDFALEVEHLDFRTLQAVNPKFPPLVGTLRGTARLDSVWTDVRFREADVTIVTDTLAPSRLAGSGRIALAGADVFYDVALAAAPLSLDALAVAYPTLPVRGTLAGSFTVAGSLNDLAFKGELSGAGGRISAGLRLDALAPTYRLEGSVQLTSVDLARLFPARGIWTGALNASSTVAVGGDSLRGLEGGVMVQIGRSAFGDLRVHTGRARASFDRGLLRIDTLMLESSVGRINASGALGLSPARSDSVLATITVDSLGGLRPLLKSAPDSAAVDSLAGSLTGTVRLIGNLDSLDLRVLARGRSLVWGSTRVERLALRADVDDVIATRAGTATLDADASVLGNIRLASVRVDVQSDGGGKANVGVQLRGADATGMPSTTQVHGLASVSWDSIGIATRLESLGIGLGARRWRLARSGTVTVSESTVVVDSLELVDDGGGRVLLVGAFPDTAAVSAHLRVDALSLADVRALVQTRFPLDGQVSGTATVSGTRASPHIAFDATARGAQVGGARVEGLHLSGSYSDRVLRPALEYRDRDGAVAMVVTAALPFDLALAPVPRRRLDLPIAGTLRADSASLVVIETFSDLFARATGRLHADLTLGGTWERPRMTGHFAVVNGAVGLPRLGAVRLENLQARVRFFGDSLHIDTLSARSGESATNRLRVFGGLHFADPRDPVFEEIRVIADRFRVIDKPGVADLEVSGALRLVGPMSRATLSGADTVVINRNIYIPDAVRKDIVALDDPEFLSLTDTSMFGNRRLLPSAPSRMVENLAIENVVVAAGPSLWLRSNEASIKLGGALLLRTASSQRRGQEGRRQLGLEGRLFAEPGGTYRLNLGVIQKTFIVESGTIQFFGEPEINPTIDISAIHTVRQYDQRTAQQDVRIRVTLEGTLNQLTAALSSPDSLRISNADLISYLTTGMPSFSIGGRASDYTETAARIAVSSLAAVLASNLAGGALDVVDVRTAGLEGYGGDARAVGGSILAGTRIGAGKQLGEKAFLRADFGLCQVGQVASGDRSFDPVAFANAVGLKLDYRMRPGLGISGGVEPPTSALLCASGASARGFVPTPRQWGADVFRQWRF